MHQGRAEQLDVIDDRVVVDRGRGARGRLRHRRFAVFDAGDRLGRSAGGGERDD
jgi:hypothetical protein